MLVFLLGWIIFDGILLLDFCVFFLVVRFVIILSGIGGLIIGSWVEVIEVIVKREEVRMMVSFMINVSWVGDM